MRRWVLAWVLAASAVCGCSHDGAVRTRAIAQRSEWDPTERFLDCERDDVRVERVPAAVLWSGRRLYWFRAALPSDAVIDPETGNLVSLPAGLADYYVASCESAQRVCYWREILFTCEGERCDVLADNSALEGESDCGAVPY